MRPFKAYHPKRKALDVEADTTYHAAQIAAQRWGFRSTKGISVIRTDLTVPTSSL